MSELVRIAQEQGDAEVALGGLASATPAQAIELRAVARLLGAAISEAEVGDASSLDRDAQSRVASVLARARLIGLDTQIDDLLPALAPADRGWICAWRDALLGVAEPDELAQLRAAARKDQRPDLVVELTCFEALALAERGEFQEALAAARRAARMALTEAIVEPALLAGVVLARVRRLVGDPHLGAHILGSLERMANPRWHDWLSAEQHLVVGSLASQRFAAAKSRPVPWFETATSGKTSVCPGLLAPDVAALSELCAGHAVSPDLQAFASGTSHVIPRGLHGLAAASMGDVAWIHWTPNGSTRFLSPGLRGRGPVARLEPTARASRSDTFLASIALASKSQPEEALFHMVFGFDYVAELHASTWRLALHRANKRLGSLGEVVRIESGLSLRSPGPFLLADPRCSVGVEDRVLLHVASGKENSARAISEALGVSLRSAQGALESLVKEGLCKRSREGNAVAYAIEDTTFHEPTQLGRLRL